MRHYHIEARDISDAWFQLVDLCYREGREYIITKGSYEGERRKEIDFFTARILYPCTQPRETRIPTIPHHHGIPDPIPGGIDYVNDYAKYLLTDHVDVNETYTYGSRLFGSTSFETNIGNVRVVEDEGISQAEEVIRRYKMFILFDEEGKRKHVIDKSKGSCCNVEGCNNRINTSFTFDKLGSVSICKDHLWGVDGCVQKGKVKRNFATNQLSMTIAQPGDIHLQHSPCLREIGTRIYEEHHEDGNKLNFVIIFRSWDIFTGLPANLCGIADLMDYMAGEIGVESGEFIITSWGAHLYDMYFDLAKTILGEK